MSSLLPLRSVASMPLFPDPGSANPVRRAESACAIDQQSIAGAETTTTVESFVVDSTLEEDAQMFDQIIEEGDKNHSISKEDLIDPNLSISLMSLIGNRNPDVTITAFDFYRVTKKIPTLNQLINCNEGRSNINYPVSQADKEKYFKSPKAMLNFYFGCPTDQFYNAAEFSFLFNFQPNLYQYINYQIWRNFDDPLPDEVVKEYTNKHDLLDQINWFLNRPDTTSISATDFKIALGRAPTLKELLNVNRRVSLNHPIDRYVCAKFLGRAPTLNELVNINVGNDLGATPSPDDLNRTIGSHAPTLAEKIRWYCDLGQIDCIEPWDFEDVMRRKPTERELVNVNLNHELDAFISADAFRNYFKTNPTYADLFNLNCDRRFGAEISDTDLNNHRLWNLCLGRDPEAPISEAEKKKYKAQKAWNLPIPNVEKKLSWSEKLRARPNFGAHFS